MAESMAFKRSIYISSDDVPEFYCEPCYDVRANIKPVAGFCHNCNEDLCLECYTGHLRRKQFQDHKLVDKSKRPKTKSAPQTRLQNTGVDCHLHHGEKIQSFCRGHSQLCCNVCLTISHQACKTEEISKLARNIQHSQELQCITKKLNTLKDDFKDILDKTGANESVIQKNHSNAIHEMHKIREEFDKLMTETESQADKVKEEDFNKIEKVAASCNIVIPQINKLTANLETLKEKGETERLFVSMKHAESQLQSLEDNLEKNDKENTVREYKFEPEARLKGLFKELKEFGHLDIFEKSGTANTSLPKESIRPNSEKKKKRPTPLKNIIVKSSSDRNVEIHGSLMLHNEQLKVSGNTVDRLVKEPLPIDRSQEVGTPDPVDDEFASPVIGTCIATYAFEASLIVDNGSVGMAENEDMWVLEQDPGDGWTRVRKNDGASSEGFVPTSYIQCQFYDQDAI